MPDRAWPPIFRVRELELRYRPQRIDAPFTDQLSDPQAAATLAAHVLRDAATEVVLVFHLNVKRRVIGVHRFCGSLNCVALTPADVMRAALLSNAHAVILAHNHLSNDPTPSPEDRAVVQRLRNAASMLSVELLDAVVVVDPAEGPQYFSFKQDGLL